MRHLFFLFGLITLTFLSCGKQNKEDSSYRIDIGAAMESIGDFGISEIAFDIAYVALETTDNSLIGAYPDFAVWRDKIVVSSMNQPLMVFNKEDGKFCNQIGHIGDDPEGFATDGWGNIPFWIDQTNGTVYLRALGDIRLLRYNLDGTFLGSVTPVFRESEVTILSMYFLHISNDVITAHNKYWHENEPYIYSFDAMNGQRLDTIASKVQPYPQGIISSSYQYNTYIKFGGLGRFYLDYSDNKAARIVPNSPSIWEYNGKTFLKEFFLDTVYTIQSSSLVPHLTLDLGKMKWPDDKIFEKDVSRGRLSIDYILENENFIYFHLHTGLYEFGDNINPYCGFFNKKNGMAKIMKGDKIEDDIHNFLPISIRKVSSAGEFVGLIQVTEIMDWKEKNRNTIPTPIIQSLIEKDVEDNPVLVIGKLKKK